MAEAIDFPGTNFTFQAPPEREDVQDLRVFRNRGAIISAWHCSIEELGEIGRSGKVFVSVLGQELAPIFVGSESVVRDLAANYGPVWPRQAPDPGQLLGRKLSAEEFEQFLGGDTFNLVRQQMLICLINRLGGEVSLPVGEVDGTGSYSMSLHVDAEAQTFTLETARRP